jgi:hypothetical protein
MPVTTVATFSQLLEALSEQNVPHAVVSESRTVEIPARHPPLDSVCYLRWEKELPYVQVICPLALGTPADRHRDLEMAIVRVNNAVPFPGFGLDHERGTLYFRYTVVIHPEGVPTAGFQKVVLAVMNLARDFVLPFREVIGGKPGDQILQAVIAQAKANQAASAGAAFGD